MSDEFAIGADPEHAPGLEVVGDAPDLQCACGRWFPQDHRKLTSCRVCRAERKAPAAPLDRFEPEGDVDVEANRVRKHGRGMLAADACRYPDIALAAVRLASFSGVKRWVMAPNVQDGSMARFSSATHEPSAVPFWIGAGQDSWSYSVNGIERVGRHKTLAAVMSALNAELYGLGLMGRIRPPDPMPMKPQAPEIRFEIVAENARKRAAQRPAPTPIPYAGWDIVRCGCGRHFKSDPQNPYLDCERCEPRWLPPCRNPECEGLKDQCVPPPGYRTPRQRKLLGPVAKHTSDIVLMSRLPIVRVASVGFCMTFVVTKAVELLGLVDPANAILVGFVAAAITLAGLRVATGWLGGKRAVVG